MSKKQAMAKDNRRKNAGGVKPDAFHCVNTLVKLFNQFERRKFKQFDQQKGIVIILYLWLTHQLDNVKFKSKSDELASTMLPDCVRVSSSADCNKHCFRTRVYGNISWVEYALPDPTLDDITYRWQPIPPSLNTLFHQFVSQQNYNVKWLEESEKLQLSTLLGQKWEFPTKQKGLPALRKDVFFKYISNCVLLDNDLSISAKSVLLGKERLHHRSATAYEKEDSDRITYKVFYAQERYINRLFQQVRLNNFEALFPIYIPSSKYKRDVQRSHTSTVSLINKKLDQSIPQHFKNEGRISQVRLERYKDGDVTIIENPIEIGSHRGIPEAEVSHFFRSLEQELRTEKPIKSANLQQYIVYFNLCTCHLALLLILLTGVRPHHAISIERAWYFGSNKAYVKDKGKLRRIILSDFMLRQINHYFDLHKSFSIRLPSMPLSQYLWHLYDENGQPKLLTARYLRRFMHARFHGKDPYMLRHVFAQVALTNIESVKLTVSQIARLMGHSDLGEHLGSDHLFPAALIPLEKHLHSLPKCFNLSEVIYV